MTEAGGGQPYPLDIAGTVKAVSGRTISAEALTEAALQRADADAWNCLSDVLRSRALKQARALDRYLAQGHSAPPLAGVPFVAKSVFNVEGLPTRSGGRADPVIISAGADAALVKTLSEAGAIMIGISRMDEYAYGFLGDNPHDGKVRNPRYPNMYSGGSSSGSAAAVAAHIVPFSIGTDTNGSVRVPAAFCGTWGLKPGYGKLCLEGSQPLATSLDHGGIFADTLNDLRRSYAALFPTNYLHADSSPSTFAIGVGDYARLSDDAVEQMMRKLKIKIPAAKTIAFDHIEESFSAASLITSYEGSRNHQTNLHRCPIRYSELLAERIEAGLAISLAQYKLARFYQRTLTRQLSALFAESRVLILPVAPISRIQTDSNLIRLNGIDLAPADAAGLFTRPVSLSGLPALVMPIADKTTGHHGALQLIAQPGNEYALFEAASKIEMLFS
jgi:Asp-tRNA(Asn)/Glu-tRNA(Gln) amidotransferase A subunit family amidase